MCNINMRSYSVPLAWNRKMKKLKFKNEFITRTWMFDHNNSAEELKWKH